MSDLTIKPSDSIAFQWYELLKMNSPQYPASAWLDKSVSVDADARKGSAATGFNAAGAGNDFICYYLSRPCYAKILTDIDTIIYHVPDTVTSDALADTFVSSNPAVYKPDLLAGVTSALPDEGNWAQVEGGVFRRFIVKAASGAAGYITIRLPYDVTIKRAF